MRLEHAPSKTLLLCGALAALSGCGDDSTPGTGGSSSSGDAVDSTTMMPMPTPTSMSGVDTTAGSVDETTSDDPTTTGPEPTTDDTTGPPPSELDAFRFTSLVIRDPHFFDTLICSDITGMVNTLFGDGLNMDARDDEDELLDLSLALVFRPLNQAEGEVGDVDFANADCTAPVDSTECTLQVGTMFYPAMYTNMADGTCHEADPAHLGGYDPPPGMTTGPCFSTAPTDVVITTTFDLPLGNAIIAAQYSGDGELVEGTIRGFLSTEDAEASLLPDSVPVVGGNPISSLLKGGSGSSILCSGDDRDDGNSGWWFYVDFTAERVPWMD